MAEKERGLQAMPTGGAHGLCYEEFAHDCCLQQNMLVAVVRIKTGLKHGGLKHGGLKHGVTCE